ncbi:MAG: succinate--CoA ligase subunit alpha [Alphaproteobacteria bacterium]|nr:succinate--CoA ligase subunit alpha [Alphaproteobacteria bacterium]
MTFLVDKDTKILIQGITGTQASFHARRSLEYGSNIVCGVTPGKGGSEHLGVPVFNTVKEAMQKTHPEASVLFVPGSAVKSAVEESVEAGIKLLICVSANVPVNDMLTINKILAANNAKMIGPNTPGLIVPNQTRLGIFPENIHQQGHIGVVSRSSTLTYEAVLEVNRSGLGQSAVVGLGDDLVIGMNFVEALQLFHQDKNTSAIVMIGEMGGSFEEEGAEWYKNYAAKKPIICYIAGDDTTFSKTMGYANDIITKGHISFKQKKEKLKKSGIIVVDKINQIHQELSRL